VTFAPRRLIGLLLVLAGLAALVWSGGVWLRAARFQAQHIAAFESADRQPSGPPRSGDVIGVLEIPRLRVCSAIVEGDDDAALAKGVAHLADTRLPWDGGNTVLAGHRDTVFRPLRRIAPGDVLTIQTSNGRFSYKVRDTRVVKPDDLSVLRDDARPTLTLITCYPFHLIGRAPLRFAVKADRISPAPEVAGQAGCSSPRRTISPVSRKPIYRPAIFLPI